MNYIRFADHLGDHFKDHFLRLQTMAIQLLQYYHRLSLAYADPLFGYPDNVPPLRGVVWEGVFGFTVVGIALFPMYFIPWHLPSGPDFWQDLTHFENAIDGFHQICYIPTLTLAFL